MHLDTLAVTAFAIEQLLTRAVPPKIFSYSALIRVELRKPLLLEQIWKRLLHWGSSIDSHLVHVACTRRHIVGLLALLQCEELISQRGLNVHVRSKSTPRGLGTSGIERLRNAVCWLPLNLNSRLRAAIDYREVRIFSRYRADAELRLQWSGRDIALSNTLIQLFTARNVAIIDSVNNAIHLI